MKFFVGIFYICILSYSINVLAKFDVNPEFNANKCVHGHASRWVNACVCDRVDKFGGKYCSEPAVHTCSSNQECPENSFCFMYQGKGSCFKNQVRDVLETPQAFYVLSDSLLSYSNAEVFCSSLETSFRPITRKDFNCFSEGAACLDKKLILAIQDTFGVKGFFWLDNKAGTNSAYYADMNDGTVYNTIQENVKSNQVLCIREKK